VLDVLSYLGIEVVPDSPAQDDVETFRAMLLGLTDSYQTGNFPPELERITFMEKDKRLAMLLQDTLAQFLLPETTSSTTGQAGQVMQIACLDSFRPEFRKPQANDATPHVFVAMPFKDRYDDQFYLAIQPCVKEAGFLCERMDLEAFTGDIVDRMFARIRTSRLTVALLDGGNPNVYLEVGYAWGVETPTILIAHEGEPLPFDVRGHRVLIYDKIYRLKQMLQAELERLLG
jgi:hypothetical protein